MKKLLPLYSICIAALLMTSCDQKPCPACPAQTKTADTAAAGLKLLHAGDPLTISSSGFPNQIFMIGKNPGETSTNYLYIVDLTNIGKAYKVKISTTGSPVGATITEKSNTDIAQGIQVSSPGFDPSPGQSDITILTDSVVVSSMVSGANFVTATSGNIPLNRIVSLTKSRDGNKIVIGYISQTSLNLDYQ